ncbi:NAD(P)H-binding protein [Solirubrobacter sp. CPCC 204708]|uniref:NAD(P)H-binding protein n=1 Tax=Solirubrobacter deserti TaxID=2282478 RepID=A0ABT4RSF4_9ACTN|nr:NAD(P)H-binding protein [Solirubrobacter deserti]MBE2315098.1 NAD(P)H-binding protein [Solirubrobacter deserti]MDA0141380.1 NAD(P)H-binding protein [Solirubrobacter deserti]
MIIVTGATGQLGSLIVERLLERVPAEAVGVSVRDPDQATSLAERGVRVRRGDFAEPDTLAAAFEGATQVLVVSVNALGAENVAMTTGAIDAAYAAGARRVLYTSQQAAAADSHFAPARDHAAVEAHLRAGGRPFTALRNGYYAESLEFQLRGVSERGSIALPADGPVSWTARADLAEAAAVILADEGRFDGPTPPLIGAEAVDFDHVAALLGVERTVVDDDAWVAGLIETGVPEAVAKLFLGSFLASRAGEFDRTDPTLATLLGRAPTPVAATF